MTCFHPKKGYIDNSKGKRKWYSSRHKTAGAYTPSTIKCGECIGCRSDKAREWGLRCQLESYYHTKKMFITLTYDEINLPKNSTLVKSDLQNFIKRIREYIDRKENGLKIKYFGCGEYGELKQRPHYHILIFGYKFKDMKFLKKTNSGNKIFRSERLEKLWKKGISSIGKVTDESCMYTAQYTMKKRKANDSIYKNKIPEFNLMSLKTALGYEYLTDNWDKIVRDCNIKNKEYEYAIPYYFLKKIKEEDEKQFEEIRKTRYLIAKQNEKSEEELRKMEINFKAKLNQRKRILTPQM